MAVDGESEGDGAASTFRICVEERIYVSCKVMWLLDCPTPPTPSIPYSYVIMNTVIWLVRPLDLNFKCHQMPRSRGTGRPNFGHDLLMKSIQGAEHHPDALTHHTKPDVKPADHHLTDLMTFSWS